MEGVGSEQLMLHKDSAFDAFRAGEWGADTRRAALGRRDPGTTLPRRIVANMLRVAAFEVGHPIAGVVLMKSDDIAARPRRTCWRFTHY
jgi:hypothetical protein